MAGGLSYESWTDAPIGMQAAQADKIIERFRNASSQVGVVMKEKPQPTPVAAVSDWIPVTEKLPEEPLQTVIVSNGTETAVAVYSVIYDEFAVMCGKNERFGVTHWMPMPKPPMEVTK